MSGSGPTTRGGKIVRRRRGSAFDQALEPTFHSRFELKYLVEPERLPELRRQLAPFMRPDRFAALHEDRRYPISSLYLDSPDLLLYHQTLAGERDRFKLRVRSYSDDPARPVYLEVKHKSNAVVHKRRVGLARETARALVERRSSAVADIEPGAQGDVDWFLSHMRLVAAGPVLRVRYLREAYEADGNEPVRITIDTELMHAVTPEADLSCFGGRFEPTPLPGAIVEIKFIETYPEWVADLVRNFELRQGPVPKYGLSVDRALGPASFARRARGA